MMDIREVIDAYVDDVCLYPIKGCEFYKGDYCVSTEGAYKCLMKRLGELGVVKKVDRELLDWDVVCPDCKKKFMGVPASAIRKAGYIVVEPLI